MPSDYRERPCVLLVEDAAPLAAMYQQYLKKLPVDVDHAATLVNAKKCILDRQPQLILLDLKLPDGNGTDLLRWLREEQRSSPVVILTAHSSVDVAVEMMQLGASDFIEKPVTASRLITTIRNLLEQSRLQQVIHDYEKNCVRDYYEGFVGSSLPMQAVYRTVDAAATSKASVFITGESGTGKEVCAEAIHRQSKRSDKPFIVLNCGAIPQDLMESEIFGHIKGAFTGAMNDRKGAAILADGGTLFLDEIGEMPMALQTKLLRFVQTGRFCKVGSNKEETVDIRFICATNRDPMKAIEEGVFREDLYYRLYVIPINLPPLRDRTEDIVAIACHFLKQFAEEEEKSFSSLDQEVRQLLCQYAWPGNVRQLQNVLRNMVVLYNDTVVRKEYLPAFFHEISQCGMSDSSEGARIQSALGAEAAVKPDKKVWPTECVLTEEVQPLSVVEREVIEHTLTLCDGNIPKAAALLEINPSTIYRKKQQWQVIDTGEQVDLLET
ncbi:Regulatory protein LuxO [invertebrate metagenome]|uniref:Regulatory protein LuxO n=1 Tax=invertebrate metagenome TaxID=1711999 RepID=A0A2H9TB74_9ZZZZ